MEFQKISDMFKNFKTLNDEQLKRILGVLLRAGVLTAAFLVIFGGFIFFIKHPHELFNYSIFKGEPQRLKYVHDIIKEALHLKGRDIIQSGILILIATPVVRVFFSLIGFLIEKDRIYVFITFIVLSILLISMFNNYIVRM